MRVRLRGVNSKRKRLADGSFKTYYYGWKGGPPLRGEPGTPEFIASYNEAIAKKVTPPHGKLLSVLQAYQASEEFLSLSPRSRTDYIGKIKLIEKEFGDFPLSAMSDQRTRGIFKAWRQRLSVSSRRQADYAWKGGPPLLGEPGTPEFIASYNEAVAKRAMPPTGKLLSV